MLERWLNMLELLLKLVEIPFLLPLASWDGFELPAAETEREYEADEYLNRITTLLMMKISKLNQSLNRFVI